MTLRLRCRGQAPGFPGMCARCPSGDDTNRSKARPDTSPDGRDDVSHTLCEIIPKITLPLEAHSSGQAFLHLWNRLAPTGTIPARPAALQISFTLEPESSVSIRSSTEDCRETTSISSMGNRAPERRRLPCNSSSRDWPLASAGFTSLSRKAAPSSSRSQSPTAGLLKAWRFSSSRPSTPRRVKRDTRSSIRRRSSFSRQWTQCSIQSAR